MLLLNQQEEKKRQMEGAKPFGKYHGDDDVFIIFLSALYSYIYTDVTAI